MRHDGATRIAGNRSSLIIRAALLSVGLATYVISPDDVVWRFIKDVPHPRAWEHALFGLAAAFLGFALFLRVKASVRVENRDRQRRSRITYAVANLLQAVGIGSLLPLPGFLMLVFGDVAASLILDSGHSTEEDPGAERDSRQADRAFQALRWRNALAKHIGLCLAFLSMVIFSIVLIDRVADVLFAITVLVSIAANSRRFVRGTS